LEYELKALEHIVSVILHPNRSKPGKLDTAFIGKYKRLAHIEKERIKIQFLKAAFEPGGENRIELYFRQHQNSLIRLADDIYNIQKNKNKGSNSQVTNEVDVIFYKEIYLCVKYLLNFIETQFSKYFDQDAKIPEAQRWIMVPEIKKSLKYLQIEFKKSEVPDDLIKITLHPFEDYSLPNSIVTYNELKFTLGLQQELTYLAKKKDKNNFTEQICNLFLRINFNSIRFFNYYIEHILGKSKSFDNSHDLIEYYSKEMKFINQVIPKPYSVYKPGLHSIREQIGGWISEELYFLEKRQRLLLKIPVHTTGATDSEPKVHTSLSVAHLSLAVKLLVDSKVITNKNSTELMKMVARNFKTDKRDHISEDSLRNKSYDIEPATIDRMKDVIKGLMGLVMRY